MMDDKLTERQAAVALAGITVLALALRLFRIDAQSAWVDEAFTIYAAVVRWDDMVRILVSDFNHPPLHTMLVRWWFALFDVGVPQARVLSAMFGTLAVPALYWLGALLFDRRTALIASFLLAISELGIIYSQEARAYSLLLLLVIIATACFARAFRSGRLGDFVLFVVVVSLLSYTHYYSAFAVAALLAYALVFRRHSAIPATWWIGGLVALVVLYLPWLTSGVVETALRHPQGAVVEHVAAQLASPIYSLNWFNNGKIAGVRVQAPWWTLPVGCLLFTLPAVWALGLLRDRSGRPREATVLLALLWVIPVVAVTALGFLHIVYDVRHVAFAAGAYYLLVARGMTLVRSRTFRWLWLAAIAGYTVLSFRTDYFVPYKENYRDAFSTLVTEARPGDCTVFGAPDGQSYGEWYWIAYHRRQAPPALIPLDRASSTPECQRIWLVWDKTFWKAGPLTYDAAKERIGSHYRPGPQWVFLGVDVQLFQRQPD